MTYDRWKLLLARNQFDELMDLTKYLHLRDQRLAFWNQINDLAENSRVRGFWPRTHIVPDPPPAPRVDSVGRFIEELGRGRARVDDMQSHLSREYAARDLNDGNHLDREQLVLLIGRNEISVGAMADIAEIVFHDIRSDTIDQIHDGE